MGYVEHGKLTEKGEFSANIYSDEILLGEIFATDFYKSLNEYQMLMIVACACYEGRERTEYHKLFHSKAIDDLKKMIWKDELAVNLKALD